MKLIIGIVVLLLGLAGASWQAKRYRSRTGEALTEDALDIIFDLWPNLLVIIFAIVIGASLIHSHITGS